MFQFLAQYHPIRSLARPLALVRAQAGFPSPAEDYVDRQLDLNEFIEHPAATFFFRLEGDSMMPLMRSGDLLVVDRAMIPRNGDVVVAMHNGELTVKRLRKSGGETFLEAENSAYPPLLCNEDTLIWGVVLINLHWPSHHARNS